MTKRRSEAAQGFSLAFIDVMACGLGAVVLLLVILEFREQLTTDSDRAIGTGTKSEEADRQKEEELNAKLASLRKRTSQLENEIVRLTLETTSLNVVNQSLAQNVSREKSRSDALSSEVKKDGNNLIGLNVQGKRVLIGLDISSSMVSEKISDAILYNAGGLRIEKSAKWEQAKFAASWVVKNGPTTSEYMIVTFNEETKQLSQRFESQRQSLERLNTELVSLEPNGGSDFSAFFEIVDRYEPDEIFLITDGLPTKVRKSFSSLAALTKACGVRARSFVSGKCREAMFVSAVNNSTALGRTRLNTILLPLEGDPRAAPLFWALTSQLGGLTLTPDPKWR